MARRAGPDGSDDATGDEAGDPVVTFRRRVVHSITTHRELWLASVEVMIRSEHNPHLRAELAAGLEAGRRGMASVATGLPEDQLDEATVRTVGSAQMALMSGVVTQWLTDPRNAPTPEEIAAGVRALAAARR